VLKSCKSVITRPPATRKVLIAKVEDGWGQILEIEYPGGTEISDEYLRNVYFIVDASNPGQRSFRNLYHGIDMKAENTQTGTFGGTRVPTQAASTAASRSCRR
jgi:hypothetical protein